MEDVHADELSSLLHTEQRIIEAEALRQVPSPVFARCRSVLNCELELCAAPVAADHKDSPVNEDMSVLKVQDMYGKQDMSVHEHLSVHDRVL